MFLNLTLGTLVVSITVLTHTFGLIALSRLMPRLIEWLRLHTHNIGKIVAMTATVLSLFVIHTVEIWAWAFLLFIVHAVDGFENALYFSTVTFSTVGYGDITPHPEWRLLAALEGINGFILIGWSTAYLVAASTRYGPFRLGEHF